MSRDIRVELTELRGRVDWLAAAVEDLRRRAGMGARDGRHLLPAPPRT